MKIEYDVDVPHNTYGKAPYASVFWKFYESEHKNTRMEFNTVKEAHACQKAICNLLTRNKIYNVIITRRENAVYLIRSDVDAE